MTEEALRQQRRHKLLSRLLPRPLRNWVFDGRRISDRLYAFWHAMILDVIEERDD